MTPEEISSRFRIKTSPVIQNVAKVSADSKQEKQKKEEQDREAPPREKDTLELTGSLDKAGNDVPEPTDDPTTEMVKPPPQIGGKLNIILR